MSYIQPPHNYRDPKTGRVRAKVLYHFGHEENLDVAAFRRLVASISRFLGPAEDEIQRDVFHATGWLFDLHGDRLL